MTTRRDRVRGVRYGTGRRRGAGLTLLAALLGLLPLLGTVAHAATTTTLPLTLTVDRISPTAPQPGDLLTVAGVLTNPTALEYDGLSIALRIQSTPLESRAALLEVAGSTDHFESDNAGTPTTLVPLAAGASVPYVLQVPIDALQLTTPGVYRIAVEVYRGTIDNREYDARVNTFLPWLPPSAAVAPVQVAWVWPMLSTPRLQPDNTFSDDGVGVEIGPVGRLGRLLNVASQAAGQSGTVPQETAPPVPGGVSTDPAPTPVAIKPVLVTPVIDPENVQELQLMTAAYTVKGGAPGAYSANATTYLAELNALLAKTTSIATPYGDPDIEALIAARGGSLVTQARSTGLESSLPGVSTGLLWPPDGALSQGALGQLTTTGLVLSSKAVPVTNGTDLGYTPTSTATVDRPGGTVPAVVVDDGLSKLATTPVRAEDRVLLGQRFAAETAAIAVEAGPSAPRTLVLAPGRRWSPTESPVRAVLDESGRLPWITPVTVPQALQAPPDPAVARAAVHRPPNQPTLPDGTATRIVQTDAELAGFRSILCPVAPTTGSAPSPATAGTPTTTPGALCTREAEDQVNQQVLQLQRSLYRSASTAFRKPGSGGEALLDATVTALHSTEDKVRIVSKGTNTLVGKGAKLPISVVNDLPVAVKVQVVLRPRSAALRKTKPVVLVLAAGAHVQTDVTVTVNSAGAGKVFVDAQLLTPTGRDYGTPVVLQVHISAAGVVVVTITIAVCGLLGLAVIVRLYRRIRNARGGPAATPDEPATAESAAGAAAEPEA
ncbi:MAG: hypothetical protein QOJ11_469 [Frankiales bacterium]|nr:hypothetical protein [Frankiales bacterium]